jgi:WD40 repeat protein
LRSVTRGIALSAGVACGVIYATTFVVPITWHGSTIVAAAFSPNGSLLATASVHSSDSVICIWDAETGRGLAKLDLPNVYAESVVFAPDGKKLTVQRAGANIRVWDWDSHD